MKYTTLGNTDIKVSKICLGTMTWGEQNTEAEGHEQMEYAVSKGVNFFDTAEMYSVPAKPKTYGRTEEIIGTWLKKNNNRKDIVLASKVAGPADFAKHVRNGKANFSKEQIKLALEASLKRLQTDYLDLYQLHWPERPTNFFGSLSYTHHSENVGTDFQDILETMQSFIKEGKIRQFGISNETPWGMSNFLTLSEKTQLTKSNEYSEPI